MFRAFFKYFLSRNNFGLNDILKNLCPKITRLFGPPQAVIFDLVENIKGSPENSTW